MLRNTVYPPQNPEGNASSFIANHRNETAGIALETLLDNPDIQIRERAVCGLGYIAYDANDKATKLKAREILSMRQKTEPDEKLRQSMAFELQIAEELS